jgi:hypothetical protein
MYKFFLFVGYLTTLFSIGAIQSVSVGKVNILGGHSIDHSRQKSVYVHVSYSERFPRYSYFTVQYTVHYTVEQHAMSSHE